jgi:hypothetical protein
MHTPLQSETSRANGALSHGPVTPEGKAASSRNATRHGFRAKSVVIAGEDAEDCRQLRISYLARYRPADDVELWFVRQMVAAQWRQLRAEALEVAAFNLLLGVLPSDPLQAKILERTPDPDFYRRQAERQARLYQQAFNNLVKLRRHHPANEPEPEPACPPEAPSKPAPLPFPAPSAPVRPAPGGGEPLAPAA